MRRKWPYGCLPSATTDGADYCDFHSLPKKSSVPLATAYKTAVDCYGSPGPSRFSAASNLPKVTVVWATSVMFLLISTFIIQVLTSVLTASSSKGMISAHTGAPLLSSEAKVMIFLKKGF